MKQKLDLTKPVQLRNGAKARVICTDKNKGCGDTSIVVLYETEGGYENLLLLEHDGRHYCRGSDESPQDLINVPETFEITRWSVVFHGKNGFYCAQCDTKEEAEKFRCKDTMAIVPFTIKGTVQSSK